jgi:outer membrane cobalamin receptor
MYYLFTTYFHLLEHTQRFFIRGHHVLNCKPILPILIILFFILFTSTAGYSEDPAQLVGRVVDKISEEPIENILVYLNPGYQYAETNAQGEYLITDIKPGKYEVSTQHVGYHSDQNQQVEIIPGEKVEVNFYLTEMHYSMSDAIVVTATRGKSSTQELPYTMSVVSEDRISLINPLNVSEVLQNIQGAYIKDYGGVGDLKTISLRGSNAGQVLVLLDGQRLNNPQTGEIDLSTISLDEIERVEILRGGSSAIYGADAIGGVLNMVTRRGQAPDGIGASLSVLGGSFITRSLDASIDIENDMVDGSVTYRRLNSDGDFSFTDQEGKDQTRQNNDLSSQNIFTAFKFELGQSPFKTNLDMSYGYYTSERGAPGPLDFPSFTARQWDTNQKFQTQFKGKVFNPLHSYNIQGFWNWNKNRFEEPEGFFATDSKNKSGNYGIESHIKSVILPHQILTYGLGYREEWMNSNQFQESHERNIYFFFVQDEIQFKSQLGVSPMSIEIIPALRYDSYSDFGSRWSPKIGASLSLGSEWQTILKLNAGSNFRAPTFNQLYWPSDVWSRGNPDLKPESGLDWDMGVNFRLPLLNRFSFDIVYFNIYMDDLIQWQSVDFIYTPVNVSKARTKGLEINTSLQLIDNILDIVGNYTYLDAKNKSDGEYNNKFLVYRSRHNLNITLNFRWNYFSFAYDYRNVSRQFSDEENSSEFEIKPYNISDFTLRFQPKFDNWQPTLSFQVRNVFDENYQIIRSYPLPGREFRVNLGVAYN